MDDRNALVDTLAAQRERLNQQAHKEREFRDKLNDLTKQHAHERDELNAEVRSIVERANGHRARRDANNHKVREAKATRDALNAEAHAKIEALNALRRERGVAQPSHDQVPLPKLKAEIRHLEYQQQTTVLTPQKEKALVELIQKKLKEIKEREAVKEETGDLKQAYDEMRAAKQHAEEAHHLVTQLANAAQEEHDAMIKLFSEADGLRKKADAQQAEFVKNKVESDRAHRAYIETVISIRDIEKVLHALRGTEPPPERERTERREPAGPTAAQRAEAEDLFEKFRRGGKLSTEDLIALQKGGRL